MHKTEAVIDQMGRSITINRPVERIVSLVPSQTELLVDLGLRDKLVGVTKFCVHPAGLKKSVALIGGTKTVNFEKVRALQPDLIIGNKEENTQSDIETLEQEFPVWMSDITDLAGSLEMIGRIGALTGTSVKANDIAGRINSGFEALQPLEKVRSVLYLIWRKPYIAAGKGTFIDDCLSRCGLVNCLSEGRYPEPGMTNIDPEVVLLSSEPYPFKEKHIEELQILFPEAAILLADGEYFSWYGSRLIGAPTYFGELLNDLQIQQ